MTTAKVLVMEDVPAVPAYPRNILGRSRALTRVLDLVSRVAPHCRTALITGATGTGKELLAHELQPPEPLFARAFCGLQLRGSYGNPGGKRVVRGT